MRHQVVVANTNATPLEFWLEPWGDGLTLEPQERARLELCGPIEVDLLVEVSAGRAVVWVNGGQLCDAIGRIFELETTGPITAR